MDDTEFWIERFTISACSLSRKRSKKPWLLKHSCLLEISLVHFRSDDKASSMHSLLYWLSTKVQPCNRAIVLHVYQWSVWTQRHSSCWDRMFSSTFHPISRLMRWNQAVNTKSNVSTKGLHRLGSEVVVQIKTGYLTVLYLNLFIIQVYFVMQPIDQLHET